MPYIDRSHSVAQEATPEKISTVVTDFISREQWKAAFRAVALANDYTKTEILLAGALADNFYCKTGKCDPGFEKLAAQINAGLRTVKLAAKTLEADGWCIRTRGGRTDKVNFTLCIPNPISAAMPALMEDVTDVSNADSKSAENGHFGGSISANTLAPLNTEVEQRRSAAASPSARAAVVETQHIASNGNKSADDAALNLASNSDISDTKSAPERRLVSAGVEVEAPPETQALAALSSALYVSPVANAAGGTLIELVGQAAHRPDTEPHHEVTKIMTDAIEGAEKHPRPGFLLRKLTPEESRRVARRTEYFAKMRQEYPKQPADDADEVEALFNRMLLDRHSFVPLTETYSGLMRDLSEGRVTGEDVPKMKTLLADNWQRVHESGRRAQRAQPIEVSCVAA